MMKMSFNVTAKKLFGVKYERLARTLFLDLVVFWGLHISGLQVKIAPAILYLMTVAFSAGVMWQALSSGDNRANLENMFMLPFEGRSLILSYVAALGAYTLLTKTIGLLAVVWAVARWSRAEILGSILCALTAIVVVSCLYPLRLGRTDAYAYYVQPKSRRRTVKVHRRYSVRRYLFRYLMAHKNYLINTVAMWGVASVLPLLLGQMEARFVLPIGFAILSLNTPLCILLSCDPALEQAVRFLPGQQRAFCIPYCLFIFWCNLAADIIFLGGWQFQIGGVVPLHALTAVAFALLSAAGSVLLEWYCPIRGWKIESDLWHHPRKYVVPAVMMLLAGLVSMF
ncbi:MAG: hypothetical protein K2P26_07050 [Oscillospiraceae bacterium]|nr:hypothetical protein [Oscillospiraceae bacterium]